jgi:hypothetical protein
MGLMLIELESIMWNIMILLINLSLLGSGAFNCDLILDYHVGDYEHVSIFEI